MSIIRVTDQRLHKEPSNDSSFRLKTAIPTKTSLSPSSKATQCIDRIADRANFRAFDGPQNYHVSFLARNQLVSIEHLAQGYGLSYTKITHSKQLWETNWAELVKNVLRTNTSTSENNDSRAKQLNVKNPDKLNPSHPTSTNSASSVRIVEFITNSQASIAERNQFRQ